MSEPGGSKTSKENLNYLIRRFLRDLPDESILLMIASHGGITVAMSVTNFLSSSSFTTDDNNPVLWEPR